MYEDLVKRLRNRANGTFEEKCEGCEFTEDFPPCAHCTIKAFNDAANAIERMDKALEDAKEYESFWEEEANEALRKFQVAVASKPRWIPVTETKKLPKDGQPVFIHIPARFRKTVSIPMIAYRDQGTWREQETHRDVYNMTHWMPLPQPPMEETE